jgi:hypothetical protein
LCPAACQWESFKNSLGLTSLPLFAQRSESKFNAVKFTVGGVNVVRGGVQTAAGAAVLTAGAATAPLGPVSAPADAVGTAHVVMGLAKVNRGAQQMSEAVDDPSGPSVRNVLGLLPGGQHYDDRGEPGPFEYAKERLGEAAEVVKSFLGIE